MAEKSSSAAKKPANLNEELIAKRAELHNAKMGLGTTLQNPHHIRTLKKDIARIMTKINATKGDK